MTPTGEVTPTGGPPLETYEPTKVDPAKAGPASAHLVALLPPEREAEATPAQRRRR